MSRRAPLLTVGVLLAAAALAGPATGQTPVGGGDLRLPDPAWLAAPPPAATTIAGPDQLLDPLLAAGEARRAEAVQRVTGAGFVAGTAQVLATAPDVRAWAVLFDSAAGARSALDTVRWALRVRADTTAQSVDELRDPADGRLVVTTAADGSTRTTVLFTAGQWLYGLDRSAGTPGDAALVDLPALAARWWQRQPERTDPAGAQPVGVDADLRAALAAAHAAATGAATPTPPVTGTVQAATYAGVGFAMARFPGVDDTPRLLRTTAAGTWVEIGDPGGPGCPRVPAPVKDVWGLSSTCPASPSAVVRPDDPDAVDVADTAFTGLGTWVWEMGRSGGAAAVADRAVANGIRTVFVKSGDGVRYWPQFDLSVGTLKAAGLRVCAWQYVYGRHPVAEARVAARAVTAGADCFVVDAEAEFEGARGGAAARTYRAARRYMGELRRSTPAGYPVGLTSFAYVDGHRTFPYSAFMSGPAAADVLMPQIYWKAFGAAVDTAMERTARWNSIYMTPIAPIAGTYRREPTGDLLRFRCLAAAYGWAGASYWSFQETRVAQWPVLARPVTSCSTPAMIGRTYPVLRTGTHGDPVTWLQSRLRTWGVPIPQTGLYRGQTRSGVRAFQRARGLEADGVAGPLTWALLLEAPEVPAPSP